MTEAKNPYIAGIPLRSDEGFFGREDIIERVPRELRRPTTNVLVLHGQRRIGKTSLLHQLRRRLPDDEFFPVFFDLQDQALLPVSQVLEDLSEKIAEEAGLPPFAVESFDEKGEFFHRSVLPRLYEALGDRRPVFLLDEFDVLDGAVEAELLENTARKALIPFLRRIMSEDLRPAFIFAVGRRADDLTLDYKAAFKASLTEEVWVLDHESAERVVRQAETNGTLRFHDEAVAHILKLTSAHPYFIQLLCQRIWERAYPEDSTEIPSIGVAEVESAVPDALGAGGHALEWLWDGLSIAEKIYAAALAEIAAEGEAISEDRINEVLGDHAARLLTWEIETVAPRELVKRRILVRDDGSEYRFAIEFLRRWVQSRKPIYEVKNELDRVEPAAAQYFALGQRLLLQRKPKEAAEEFQRALDEYPQHFRALLYFGEACLELGAFEEAVAKIEDAYGMDREEARLPLVRALMARARQLEEEGSRDEALVLCEQVLSLSPREKDAQELREKIWTARGREAFQAGDFEAALADYQRAGNDHLVEMVEIELRARHHAALITEPTGRTLRALTRGRRWRAVAAGLILVLLAISLGYYRWSARLDIRPSVAVLSLQNRTGHPDGEWLSVAIAELLRVYVAAGGDIRTVSGEWVDEVERDLTLGPFETLSVEERNRVRLNLGVDTLIGGSYEFVDDRGLLSVTVELEDIKTGRIREVATRTGVVQPLADLVRPFGDPLRQELGAVALTPEQQREAEMSFPTGVEAGELYVKGLVRLWRHDFDNARRLLSDAVAAEPEHPLPYVYLSDTWLELGNPDATLAAAEKALELADLLPDKRRREINARFHAAFGDWDQAIAVARTIYETFPDDLEAGFRLVIFEIDAERPDDALATLDDLAKLPAAAGNPRVALFRAKASERRGEPLRTLGFAREVADQAKVRGANHIIAEARFTEAKALLEIGDTEVAVTVLDEAIQLFQGDDDPGGMAAAYELKADAISRTDLDVARRLYGISREIYRKSGDQKNEARVLMNLGVLLLERGHSVEARELFSETMATFDRLGARQEKADGLVNLGAIYHEQGELQEARVRYTQALSIFQDLGDALYTALVLTNIGELLYLEGNLDSAHKMHEEAREINLEQADEVGAAYDTYRLGMVLAAQGEWASAGQSYEEALVALEESLELAARVAATQTCLEMARLALMEDELTIAEKLAREIEEESRLADLDDEVALAQALLARTLLAQGKTLEARNFAELATQRAAASDEPQVRLRTAIVNARLQAAAGDVGGALLVLVDIEAEASAGGRLLDSLEVRLEMGEIELMAGRVEAGRRRLSQLRAETEASVRGITRRAERLLGTS